MTNVSDWLATVDKPAQEPPRGMLVPMLAEHRVQKFTITVDGAVQIAPAPGHLHVRLVEVPGVSGTMSAPSAELVGEQRSEAPSCGSSRA